MVHVFEVGCLTTKEIKFYKQKVIPKNTGIAQKGTEKSSKTPEKVLMIMAHSHITTSQEGIFGQFLVL